MLTAPNSTSRGLTRLGRNASQTVAELGLLADLVGTWHGSHGFELIAVPVADPPAPETFRVIARPYVEELTFAAIGAPVPNRGGPAGDMFITGLTYGSRISDKESDEPLHLENGMWLNLGPLAGDLPVARLASIPHGDALLALGTAEVTNGPPEIPLENATPLPVPFPGYLEGKGKYSHPPTGPIPAGIDYTKWTASLREAIEKLHILQTIVLSVSTASGGGIVNIPFVDANAVTTGFTCTYWIETVRDPDTGQNVMQLQYMQRTDIRFIKDEKSGEQILWPHVNFNTLRLQ